MKKTIIAILVLAMLFSVAASGFAFAEDTEEADVVIVGAGIAGLGAAVEFERNAPELKVVLLEKNGFAGGSAFYSEGLFLGFSDDQSTIADPDEFVKLFHTSSGIIEEYGFVEPGYEVNDDLVRNVFSMLPVTVPLLNDEIGANIHYEDIPYYNENSYDDDLLCYASEGAGAGLVTAIRNYISNTNIDLRLNSTVTDLVTDGTSVTGVVVKTTDGEYTIHSKYVILATGGMGADTEALLSYNPNFANAYFEVNPGATGDGIKLTRKFGTPLIGDGVLGLISSFDDLYQLMGSNFMVNMNGKRFCNETLNTYLLLNALQNLAQGEAYVIADSNYYNEAKEEVDYKIEAGTVVIYDTLEEVCAATGIDYNGLMEEIQDYNSAVDAGENPEFDLDVASAHKITDGPFYVEMAGTYCFGTLRGIKTDSSLNVLNENLEPIPGLYAAGETAVGNVFTGQYSKSGGMVSFGFNSGTFVASELIDALK